MLFRAIERDSIPDAPVQVFRSITVGGGTAATTVMGMLSDAARPSVMYRYV